MQQSTWDISQIPAMIDEWRADGMDLTDREVGDAHNAEDSEHLPPGWERVAHDDGQIYYENR